MLNIGTYSSTKYFIIGLFIQHLRGDISNQLTCGTTISLRKTNPEFGFNTVDFIKLHNFSYEEHTVSTQDGYFIKIQRVIRKDITPIPKYPVLLMHGISCSSVMWVDNCEASLAFILANHGYDVWLGNVRGNPYGREHLNKKFKSKLFWNFRFKILCFIVQASTGNGRMINPVYTYVQILTVIIAYSFSENGVQDVPSIIDLILKKTGFHQLHYVGHSMGTTMLFVLLSSKPEYNLKIKSFIALAPVVYVDNLYPSLQTLLDNFTVFKSLLTMFHQYALIPNPALNSFLLNAFCPFGENKCDNLISFFVGNNTSLLNKARIPLYVSHCSAGTSLNTLSHYLQIHTTHNFSNYDYESSKINAQHYNKPYPPLYDLRKISAPVALFWSEGDFFTDSRDVARLASQLPNVILNYVIPFKNFSHADFMWAMNGRELLYDKIIETMESFQTPLNERP